MSVVQEWGSAAAGGGAGGAAGAEGGGGRALPAGALRAWPPALALGRAALGAARAATVTLTNTANATMHLASVAGTTPDFHASFFDSKVIPPKTDVRRAGRGCPRRGRRGPLPTEPTGRLRLA